MVPLRAQVRYQEISGRWLIPWRSLGVFRGELERRGTARSATSDFERCVASISEGVRLDRSRQEP